MSEQDSIGLEQGGFDDASRQSKQSAQLGCCLAHGSWPRRNVYRDDYRLVVDGTGREQHVPSAAKAIKALAGL